MGKSASYSNLERQWYGRLKAEGFRDIEHVGADGAESPYLSTGCRTDSGSRLATQPEAVEATRVYHTDAGEFLHAFDFANRRDRAVWTSHAAGQSLREIATKERISLRAAWATVNRLAAEMKKWRAKRLEEDAPAMRGAGVDPARVITDDQWRSIEAVLPQGRASGRGRRARAHRPVVSALVFLARTALPWRELPPAFGSWKTVYSRFRAWVRAGVWEAIAEKIAHLSDSLICRTPRRFEALTA